MNAKSPAELAGSAGARTKAMGNTDNSTPPEPEELALWRVLLAERDALVLELRECRRQPPDLGHDGGPGRRVTRRRIACVRIPEPLDRPFGTFTRPQ